MRPSRSKVPRAARPAAREAEPRRAPLRLTVTRGALGLELYEPVSIGPLVLAHLALTLPGLEFPLDLSGGVKRFRSRRGVLQSAELVLSENALSAWLSREWQALLGGLLRPVSVWSVRGGCGLGLVGKDGALAFELHFAPDADALRFIAAEIRGVVESGPITGHVLRALDMLARGWAERDGRVLSVVSPATALAGAVLPALGVRIPRVTDVRLGELERVGSDFRVYFDSTLDVPRVSPEVLRELELARLCAEADDLLARGELDSARTQYVRLLERAPRHPELSCLIAEIDLTVGGRAEAALGLLREAPLPNQGGAVLARVLAEAGDLEQARDALAVAHSREVFGPVAALHLVWLAKHETSGIHRAAAFDQAVLRAPSLASIRTARFVFRAERGDIEGALEDAAHLEAAESGPRERHLVCRRVAEALLRAGFVKDAGRLFERALRYLPDDAVATAGLARAFLETGKRDRALLLLDRAVVLSDREGRRDFDALVDLSYLLADYLHDYPQAIARIRQVPSSSPRNLEARALEATWRAKIGDLVGASLAYARLRDAVELSDGPPGLAPDWLFEAARFERDVRRDLLAAERHLGVALAKRPASPALAQSYREVAELLAEAANARRGAE